MESGRLWKQPEAAQLQVVGLLQLPIQMVAGGIFTAVLVIIAYAGFIIPPGVSPEDEAGFFSQLFFYWFTPLIKAGHHHPLEASDLYPLAKGTASGELGDKFEIAYKKIVSRSDESCFSRFRWKGLNALMALITGVLGWKYWANVFLKMVWISFRIAQVYLLRAIVTYVTRTNGDESTRSVWFYVALSLLLFIATLGQSFALNHYHFYGRKFGLKAQTAVAVAVQRKVLRISQEALNSTESLKGRMGNLIMNDTERLLLFVQNWHLLWFGVVEVTLLAGLISAELGLSGLFCFPFLVVQIAVLWFLAGLVARSRKKSMTCADSRVHTMGSVLHDMRSVKLNAWEPYFSSKISEQRRLEIRHLLWANTCDAVNNSSVQTATLLLPLILFSSFSFLFGKRLTPPSVFATVAFINVFCSKLLSFPLVFRLTAEAMISLSRLDRFFELPEKDSGPTSLPTGKHDVAKDQLLSASGSLERPTSNQKCLHITRADFAWSKICSSGELSADSEHFSGDLPSDKPAPPRSAGQEVSVLALKGIDIKINAGELFCIIGPVGSGKSSLLLAILGELHLIRGSIQTFSTMAYCAQHPWVMNGTVRENITLFASSENEFDNDMYDLIVDACCLTDEIRGLPAGDLTEIGERGVNLSGGQKARLALARAIYADCDMYLFDDPLSAVDSVVGNRLKDQVFGPSGILSKKTRVVVTHQLRLLPLSQSICVLEAGSIVASGSLPQLKSEGQILLNIGITDEVDEGRSVDRERSALVVNQSCMNLKEKSFDEASHCGRREGDRIHETFVLSSTRGVPPEKGIMKSETCFVDDGHLTINEDRRVGRVSRATYWTYVRAAGGIPAVFSVLAAYTIAQGTLLTGSWWLARWSTADFDQIEDPKTVDTNLAYALVLLGFTIAVGIFFQLQGSIVVSRLMAASRRLHDLLLDRIMRATPTFFETNPSGRILNRFSRDVDDVDSLLPPALLILLKVVFIALGAIVMISWILPWFLISLLPMAAMFWFFQHSYVLSSRELKRLSSISKSPPYSLYAETLTGLLTIRAHAAQKEFVKRFQQKLDQSTRATWQFNAAKSWLSCRLGSLASIVVLLTSLIIVIISGRLDAGLAGVALSQSLLVANVFQQGAVAKADCENVFTGVERICTMATETPTEAPSTIQDAQPDSSWPSRGVLEFDDVELRYRPHLKPALRNLSFKTKPFERIGVCGRTAAGKSSIFVALFRMVELWGGRILIDGIDISKIGLRDLRTSLAIVPQEPALFSATLRENIDPLATHSDAELWAALDHMHMKAAVGKAEHGGVKDDSGNLLCGLDQLVRDQGQNFSSGERQLLCLTRVLLSDVRIVVLDEATASVDNKTDGIIQQAMRKHLQDRTLITIAHRLGTIVDYDRILVMDEGVAVEFGSPRDLLELDGYFAELLRETGAARVQSCKDRFLLIANETVKS